MSTFHSVIIELNIFGILSAIMTPNVKKRSVFEHLFMGLNFSVHQSYLLRRVFNTTLCTNRTVRIVLNVLIKTFSMKIMSALSKRYYWITRIKEILITYTTLILLKSRYAIVTINRTDMKTHSTFVAVLNSLSGSNSTYSTTFAMKNLFILSIIPKLTNGTIVFGKLNLTFNTLVGLFLKFLTHQTSDLLNFEPIHRWNLTAFWFAKLSIMAKSTHKFFIAARTYNSALSLIMRASQLLLGFYDLHNNL
jgi:hypothetical protein